jgi:hypothetical protein
MSRDPEPIYRIQGYPEVIDNESVCVTFRRLGADADPGDTITRKMSRANYDQAILGTPIPPRKSGLGGVHWSETDVLVFPACD